MTPEKQIDGKTVEELMPVHSLFLTSPVGTASEASTGGMDEERQSLKLAGADWVDDGLGLLSVSLRPSSGVKAFWLFLLTLIALPVLMLWFNPSAEKSALELLGSLATLGAVRAIVVGDKLVPSAVDVYLGFLLLFMAFLYLFGGKGGRVPQETPEQSAVGYRRERPHG